MLAVPFRLIDNCFTYYTRPAAIDITPILSDTLTASYFYQYSIKIYCYPLVHSKSLAQSPTRTIFCGRCALIILLENVNGGSCRSRRNLVIISSLPFSPVLGLISAAAQPRKSELAEKQTDRLLTFISLWSRCCSKA